MAFKFCPECGKQIDSGARFCGGCGQSLAPFQAGQRAVSVAGIVTLVSLVLLGGGFWLYLRLAPEPPRALKPGERAPGVMANAPAAANQPAAHPPFELPDDIKTYIANLEQEATENPQDTEKWTTLAGVYFRASRLDPAYAGKATETFEHVLSLDENNLQALSGLGTLAANRGDFPKAISFYERHLALAPGDAEVRTALGTTYFQSGNSDLAIAEYERALATSPQSYQTHFNLAIVYDGRGEREESRASLEKARDAVTDPQIKQRLTALLDLARSQDLSLSGAAQAMQNPALPAGAPAAAGAGTAAPSPADPFQGAVEKLFRGHNIAGPRVVNIEWPEADYARVLMASFPMERMPEPMKLSYLGKMKQGVVDAQQEFDRKGPVRVELIDQPTGTVMATVDTAEDQN